LAFDLDVRDISVQYLDQAGTKETVEWRAPIESGPFTPMWTLRQYESSMKLSRLIRLRPVASRRRTVQVPQMGESHIALCCRAGANPKPLALHCLSVLKDYLWINCKQVKFANRFH
jgi:hypothetical protein